MIEVVTRNKNDLEYIRYVDMNHMMEKRQRSYHIICG